MVFAGSTVHNISDIFLYNIPFAAENSVVGGIYVYNNIITAMIVFDRTDGFR